MTENSTDTIVIAAFYHFAHLPDFEKMKEPLLAFCNEHRLKGTVLLAKEGINSTISGSREAIDALYTYLRSDTRLAGLQAKESFAAVQPFLKMKVRLKREIVAMGVDDLDTDNYRGDYIPPQEWDAFISNPDVIVVDTRNYYEVGVGTFTGAIDPRTTSFRQFPAWVDEHLADCKEKKIAMYCTGGIRCEKSTAYLKQNGFKHVYHLQGGILQYFEDTKNVNGKWQGDCFVFDDRAMVDSNLNPSNNVLCPTCQSSLTTDDIKHSPLHEGVRCSQCRGLERTTHCYGDI